MSIFPRPLKKVLGKIIPFSQEDKVPTFNLGSGVADSTTVLHGDGTWSDDFDHIDFNQFPIAGGAERRMRWNDADGTVDLGLKGGNVTLQLGQENLARVVNKTSPLIDLLESNYQVVRISGATGQRLSVRLALADNDINSATTIGIVTENIPKNQEGFITTFGLVRDIDTTGLLQGETWVDGDILYLSGTVPGQLTNIKPSAPTHLIVVGYVEYAHANHGKIFVKVDNGYELDELHNVSIPTTPTNGQVLTFNGTTALWEAQSPATGITVGTTPVTSGTDGRVFFQSGGVVQQDAEFLWDNVNKRLSIGTPSTLGQKLSVQGNIVLRDLNHELWFGNSLVRIRRSGNRMFFDGFSGFDWVNTSTSTTMMQLTNSGQLTIGATTAAARLDVRAQGALSTDIAFRVRNSANTADLINIQGNNIGNFSKVYFDLNSGVPQLFNIDTSAAVGSSILLGTSTISLRDANANFVRFIGGGVRSVAVSNGAANTGLADAFEMYSADIVAGNAAPHFRTENGSIIKLFKGAALTASDGTLANAVTRIAELEARLQAHGLIA